MDKLKMETPDMVAGNIEKIGALFPAAVTEMRGEDGQIKMGINFEVLKQLLSPDVVEGDECYEFTWVGKKQAMAEAARPTTKTLRPVKEDSRNWDTTENLYIEGDNLEVLKILQESYLGKIKMIYIDPPYNTGHDFLYKDNYYHSQIEEDSLAGVYDEEGSRLFENSESNGRFHSDWCSMIYSRLSTARNLLSNDGAVFISIDDNEQENLRAICNEVFGEANYVATVTRIAKRTSDKGTYFRPTKDYILVYAKNKDKLPEFGVAKIRDEKDYPFIDDDGRRYKKSGASLFQPSLDSRPNQRYYIKAPDGSLIIPPGNVFPTEKTDGAKVIPQSNADKVWRWSVDSYFEKKHLLIFTEGSSKNPLLDEFGNQSKWNVYPKVYYDEDIESTLHPEDVIYDCQNSKATKELNSLGILFPFAKPTELIRYLISFVVQTEGVVLDFFSGSATTAHAVMRLNAEDGGHRKFIMVQLPEPCDEKSEAFKAGYKNICEIGKERIRRAGDKIKTEHPDADLDIGFRVFRVDESNMKNVYYHPEEVTQLMLGETVSNIKEDRTDLDLLYACLLDWGVEINLPHISTQVAGCTVHNVDNGALAACFDKAVPRAVVEYMANLQPLRAVFRDSAFATDAEKINVTEIFKNLSPDTKVKVI